jgi:hypothetical protein
MSTNDPKVTALFGGGDVVPAGEPVPLVVEFVESLLARAKSGDMRAIAVAYVKGNRVPADGWERERTDGSLTFILHSAIACLMGEFTDEMNATSVSIADLPVGEGP